MKRFLVLLPALLSLSLLSGCMSAVVVTSPLDEAFQEDWEDSMDELRKDMQEDLEDSRDEDSSWDAWAGEGKAHRWKVLDAQGQELCAVTDEEAVKTLDDILLYAGSGQERLAKDSGEPACTYVYSQEETLKAGQAPEQERAYEDLLYFTVSATEDVVTVQILDGLEELSLLPGVELEDVLTFPVAVPAETAETLRDWGQFSE